MKNPMHDIDAFNAVNPKTVRTYLEHQGWSKWADFPDKADIWAYTNFEGKRFEVLLPGTTDMPDYASRMDDVFRVLELLEQRSKSELFNDLVDVRAIATDKKCEVLNLHFYFSGDKTHSVNGEVSAKHFGVILESLQSLFDSIGQVKLGRANRHGRIAKDITDRTKLNVSDVLKNPFGIRLIGSSQSEQLELIDRPLSELVTQEFLEILHQSSQKNFEKLSEKLFQLQRRATSDYRKFLLSLIDANLDLSIDWGSPNSEQGGSALVTCEDAKSTMEVIRRIGIKIPLDYQISAELIAFDLINRELKFRDIEFDAVLSVKLSDETPTDEKLELTLGRMYEASIREVVLITPENQEGVIKRTLTALELWHLNTSSNMEAFQEFIP